MNITLNDSPLNFTVADQVISFILNAVTGNEQGSFRLLENDDFRILENGDFRILE